MKSLNQQIFEILEAKFPGELAWELYVDQNIFNFETEIKDALWLAEKVGILKQQIGIKQTQRNTYKFTFGDMNEVFEGDSIPEVICRAVIAIYGGGGK